MARHRGLIASISVGTLALALAGVVANAQPPQEAAAPGATTAAAAVGPPNVVLIVTDDQSPETLPHTPPVMPYLQERMNDPADHWVRFSNTFVNTPLCCPARATMLTGQYSHRTGVSNNGGGKNFRDTATLATWLDSAGYTNALVGKYLNQYPWGRGPFTPPGWDRWVGFTGSDNAPYYNYSLVEDGTVVNYGSTPADYSTDVLSKKATDFISSVPAEQPFFLYFAPPAPHYLETPPPRYATALAGMPPHRQPNFDEPDVSDKPAWVKALPRLGATRIAKLDRRRLDAYRSLLGVDDAVESIMTTLETEGVLDNTIVIYLSDHGLALGEHRWTEKLCAYDECIRTPMVIRDPTATSHTESRLVTNVDLAQTIQALTGATATIKQDGRSLTPLLRGPQPTSWRTGLLLRWVGSSAVTAYWGIRTADYLYTELSTGEKELYDLTGRNGTADPYQLTNRANTPSYATIRSQLASQLAQLRAQPPT